MSSLGNRLVRGPNDEKCRFLSILLGQFDDLAFASLENLTHLFELPTAFLEKTLTILGRKVTGFEALDDRLDAFGPFGEFPIFGHVQITCQRNSTTSKRTSNTTIPAR